MVAAVALLVASAALPGPLSGLGPHAQAGRAALRHAGAQEPQGLADLLKAQLDPRAFQLVGPLLPGAGGTPGKAVAPQSLGDLLGMAGADGVERLPIPQAAGPEPLLHALQDYMTATGVDLPAPDALRPAIAGLHLAAPAESALAQLVLAYTQALRLQAQAMQALTPSERLLVEGETGATADWFAAHPGAGTADLAASVAALAHDKVDHARLLQAGDLLSRTVEAVRIPLGNVAALAPGAEGPLMPQDSTASSGADIQGAWQSLRSDLASLVSEGSLGTAGARTPSASLDEALRDLVRSYGFSDSFLGGPVSLPGSLDLALAQLVDAQTAAATSPDGRPQVGPVLDAAEQVEPTLRAWAALLQDPSAPASADRAGVVNALLVPAPSPGAVAAASQALPESLVGPPPALAPLLEAQGLSPLDAVRAADSLPLPVAGALAYELAARATLASAYGALFEGLPEAQLEALLDTPRISELLSLDQWTPMQANEVLTWAQALNAVDPARVSDLREAQVGAAQATQAAAGLLAPFAHSSSQRDSSPAGLPVPEIPTSALVCPSQSPFSDCGNDVFLSLGAAGGILVTGPGSSRLSALPVTGQIPQITIDLGGDDQFGFPAGAAQLGMLDGTQVSTVPQPPGNTVPFSPVVSTPDVQDAQYFGVHIDVGGNDTYASSAPVAQGAALGLGTVGILWDLGGNDSYLAQPSESATPYGPGVAGDGVTAPTGPSSNTTLDLITPPTGSPGDPGATYGQGFGGDGGFGMLVDASGSDEYSARGVMAQGVGKAPSLQVRNPGTKALPSVGDDLGGTGILLDLGAGADGFTAATGQGHSEGHATVGILFDQDGASAYVAQKADLGSQGGRGAGTDRAGTKPPVVTVQAAQGHDQGLALLLDLGGAGDTYTSPPFADSGLDPTRSTLLLTPPKGDASKHDDRLWLDWTRGVALGIDSTLADEDGDHFPNLVELLAGSDPKDSADTPTQGALRAPDSVGESVGRIQAVTADTDGDGFPDYVETQLGSDPNDLRSTPVPVPDTRVLFDLPILCPASNATDCDGALTCPPAMGDECISLLTVGGPDSTTYRHRSLLQVDLDGDDNYLAPVAASTSFWVPQGNRTATHGGISIDLSGNDHYGSPEATATQAYSNGDVDLLLDLRGNDIYEAADTAQASSIGDGGAALLADFSGNDVYRAGPKSQAYATFSPPAAANEVATAGSWAALVDLAGDDSYRFDAQALVTGQNQRPSILATAFLLDAGGSDTYNSTSVPTDPAGPSAEFPATVFETQGAVDVVSGNQNEGGVVGVFADLGGEPDVYLTLDPTGGVADVSAEKDGAGLIANPVHAEHSGTRVYNTSPFYAAAFFIDGGSPSKDSDGDRWPDLTEALAGTDPHDPQEHPITTDPAAPIVAQVTPDGGLVGEFGSFGTLRLPGLVIGGNGSNTYEDYVPFLVDLGGNDTYLSPSAGGTFAGVHALAGTAVPGTGGSEIDPDSVALLLDVGDGDDTYHPADCIVDAPPVDADSFTGQDYSLIGNRSNAAQPGAGGHSFTTCPSLGGAADGIAVLADNGGHNDFRSRTWVNASVASDADRHLQTLAWGTTQGSSLFEGVGILATWNATNRFQAEVHVTASETDPTPRPIANAIGLAQGAAWGSGIGILASFGQGDDDYGVITSAHANRLHGLDGGLAEDVSQGAAVGGQGILLDEGGRNTFHAPNGRAQGFAAPFQVAQLGNLFRTSVDPRYATQVLGVLWSGPGDDMYDGGDASQGSAGLNTTGVQGVSTVRSLGLLLDGGGNDLYALEPAAAADRVNQRACATPQPLTCAISQGAGINEGTGILLDLAGDDRYEAGQRSHVQASASGSDANGLLLDLGGNDVHRAASAAQAFAETGGKAVLVDLAGRDGYVLPSQGQGYVRDTGTTVFLDAGGVDRYDYGGQKVANTAVLSTPPHEGNDWMWTSPAPGGSATSEFDADVETTQQALDLYGGVAGPLGAPSEVGHVTLQIARHVDGSDPVGEGGTAGGSLYLFATATPASGFRVQRVNVMLDGLLLGEADPLATSGGQHVFRLPWDTRGAPKDPAQVGVPDGSHGLAAAAFFQPGEEATPAGGSFAGQADGIEVQSVTSDVVIDNPPVAAGALASDALAAIGRNALSPARGQTANLTVRVSRDAGTLPSGGLPGAMLTVVLRDVSKASSTKVYNVTTAYAYNATLNKVTLDGHCQVGSMWSVCPDGSYRVNTTVIDTNGQTSWLPEMPLLIDGTPPSSAVQMQVLPAWTGLGSKVGFSGLSVQWASDDDSLHLGPGNVAGVAGPLGRVTVMRLDESGKILESQQFGGGATSYPFQNPAIGTGDTVHFLTVATDALGNQESPCLHAPDETPPCFLGKAAIQGGIAHLGIDFSPPQVSSLHIGPQADVQASTDVTVSAIVTEEAPGLVVQLRLSGQGVSVAGTESPTLPMTKGAGDLYSATVRFDAPAAPNETKFSYTVLAKDRADNGDSKSGIGLLDTKAPALQDLAVTYVLNGTVAPVGRPGSHALVSMNVTDAEVASVTVRAPPFGEAKEVPCTPSAGAGWECDVAIPYNATNGDYAMAANATDVAGNLRSVSGVLTVAGAPPRIRDASAVATGPGSVRVRWNTTSPATSQVKFGTTNNTLDAEAVGDCATFAANGHDCAQPRMGTQHEVNVTGLQPGTKYYLQPAPRSPSGVTNETSPVLSAVTGSGFRLSLSGVEAGAAWKGSHDVGAGVEFLSGDSPVAVTVSLQGAAQDPQQVGSFTGSGQRIIPIDTRSFGDGLYTVVVDGQRTLVVGGQAQIDKQQIVSEPFRLDNTPPVLVAGSPRPGLTSSTATPSVTLAVTDPFNTELPSLGSLATLIDGSPFTPVAPAYSSQGTQQLLTFALPAMLPSGDHELTVRLTDAAGNVGEAKWAFRVDAAPPSLDGVPRIAYMPGLTAAAPASRVAVDLNATDPSGVADVAINLTTIHGGIVRLFALGAPAWNGSFEVPANAPAGTVSLPVEATDGLGNSGPIGSIQVVIDRNAPVFVSTVADLVNLTAARLTVITDEPTTLTAQVVGQPASHGAAWSTKHAVLVSGLRPGARNNVTLVAHDVAGHDTPSFLLVQPANDVQPPSAPGNATAVSDREGLVELSWLPAADNAGVAHYEVARLDGDERTVLPPTNATRLSDDGAPAGRTVTYEVTAVDVAGQRGPAQLVEVHVLALPHLSNASISPSSGPSDRPFRVEVTYSQPAGVAPQAIALRYGDMTFVLQRAGNDTDCQAGCTYSSEVLLPPLSILHARPTATILAKADGQSAELSVAAPLVSAGGAFGVAVGAHKAPGVGAVLVLIATAAMAVIRRRRQA